MEDGEWELPNPKVQEQERQAWTQEQKPWKPKNLKIDPERQARLKEKMENSMKKLESSKFYTSFIEQLKSPEVSDHFRLALGNETQFKMVIYGIGKIESHDEYEYPRLQLSMAILMRKEFDWIGDNMEVFDPVLSATEINILESLGCTVLYVNEQCHREALKPTIFFMPYCFRTLYGNLLQANWKVDLLSRMVLFGNSFKRYVDYPYLFSDINGKRATERITAARRFTREFAIKTVSYAQARKAAEKAREVVKVEERVNRAVMVANRAANAARVAATKAVQTQTFQSSSGDDPL